MITYSEILKKYMVDNGLDHRSMAKVINDLVPAQWQAVVEVSPAAVWAWQAGKRRPSGWLLLALYNITDERMYRIYDDKQLGVKLFEPMLNAMLEEANQSLP